MIFETERLIVRKLKVNDLASFHNLESNPNVLRFADGEVKSLRDNKKELSLLINKYDIIDNDFWIYAIDRKTDSIFIGTVAFVKDDKDDEIGYRFIEDFWGKGYGLEICNGILQYAKLIGKKKLIGYVVEENVASLKILEKVRFKKVNTFTNKENQKEIKYQIIL